MMTGGIEIEIAIATVAITVGNKGGAVALEALMM